MDLSQPLVGARQLRRLVQKRRAEEPPRRVEVARALLDHGLHVHEPTLELLGRLERVAGQLLLHRDETQPRVLPATAQAKVEYLVDSQVPFDLGRPLEKQTILLSRARAVGRLLVRRYAVGPKNFWKRKFRKPSKGDGWLTLYSRQSLGHESRSLCLDRVSEKAGTAAHEIPQGLHVLSPKPGKPKAWAPTLWRFKYRVGIVVKLSGRTDPQRNQNHAPVILAVFQRKALRDFLESLQLLADLIHLVLHHRAREIDAAEERPDLGYALHRRVHLVLSRPRDRFLRVDDALGRFGLQVGHSFQRGTDDGDGLVIVRPCQVGYNSELLQRDKNLVMCRNLQRQRDAKEP